MIMIWNEHIECMGREECEISRKKTSSNRRKGLLQCTL